MQNIFPKRWESTSNLSGCKKAPPSLFESGALLKQKSNFYKKVWNQARFYEKHVHIRYLYIWYNRMNFRTESATTPLSSQYHLSIFFTSSSKFDLRQGFYFKHSSASSLRLLRGLFMLKFSNICATDCIVYHQVPF